MQTHVVPLDSVFEPPEDGARFTIGTVELTPEEAGKITETLGFERQRDADMKHIRMLADMMSNDEFAEGSQLTFAQDKGSGAYRLVDGQHRLRAAVVAEWTGKWCVRVMHGNGKSGAQDLYVLLDGNMKKRPPSVIGRALGFRNLSERMQGVIIGTARYMNQWKTSYDLPFGCSYPPIRDNIAQAREMISSFVEADQILNLGRISAQARRRMATAQVLAIVVETLAVTEDATARNFWTDVASSGDGVAGELRDNLIAGKPRKSGALYVPRLVGLAWNQRDSAKLRRDSTRVVKVAGTRLEIPA